MGGGCALDLVVALVLVLASGLGLLAALDAGALVVLLLAKVSQNAGLGAGALETLQSRIQRFVFLNLDGRHLFPSPQLRRNALRVQKFSAIKHEYYIHFSPSCQGKMHQFRKE